MTVMTLGEFLEDQILPRGMTPGCLLKWGTLYGKPSPNPSLILLSIYLSSVVRKTDGRMHQVINMTVFDLKTEKTATSAWTLSKWINTDMRRVMERMVYTGPPDDV